MNISPNGPKLPMATFDIKNPEINSNHGVKDFVYTTSSKREKKGDTKREKLTKADIGSPTNFRHIAHVEWRENIGFDLNNLAAELKCLFEMCGIILPQLEGKENCEVISGFTEWKGTKEDVKDKMISPLPMTPLLAHVSVPVFCTFPPPDDLPLSMVMNSGDGDFPSPGSRSALPPPPPPPDPPNFALPISKVTHRGDSSLPSPANKSALLVQIREGIKLKEVKQRDSTNVPPSPPVPCPPPPPGPPPPASPPFTVTSRNCSTQPSPSNRSALLTQIREGIQLKKVTQKHSTSVPAF